VLVFAQEMADYQTIRTESASEVAAIAGIILFFIFAFFDPCSPPGEIAPDQFRQLLAEIEAETRSPD
jgi:hypothetical protein